MNKIVEKYKKWKAEYPDEDYQYDQIFEFMAGLSRGEMQDVFEFIEKQQGLFEGDDNEGF